MGKASSLQTNFLGGEWSPFSQGRADLPGYKTALASCLNAFPLEEGCWVRRPGSALAGNTYLGRTACKIIDFDLTGSTPIKIEFTQQYARFWWGTQLMYDGQQSVTSMTASSGTTQITIAANPVDPKTGAGHLFASGTEVMLVPQDDPTKLAMGAQIANRTFIIQGSGTTFTLSDGVNQQPVPFAALGWTAGALVVMRRVLSAVTPYSLNTDLPNIRLVQSEMQGTLLCPNYPPQVIQVVPLTASALDPSLFVPGPFSLYFNIFTANLVDGPYLDPLPLDRVQVGCTISPGFVYPSGPPGGTYTMTVPAGALGPNNGLGFQATDVGRAVRVFIEPPDYTSTAVYTSIPPQPSVVKYNNGYWICVAANPTTGAPVQISGIPPGDIPTPNVTASVTIGVSGGSSGTTNLTTQAIELIYWVAIPVSLAAWWFYGVITAVNGPTSASVTFNNPGFPPFPYPLNPALQSQTFPPYTYQLGVYSGTTGYPTCGCYHDDRLWLGGAVPNRIDGTIVKGAFGTPYNSLNYTSIQTGAIDTTILPTSELYIFSPTDLNGNVLASNAVAATFASNDSNKALWMVSSTDGLVVGTQGGEWLVASGGQGGIGPASITARKMTKYGCANIEPRVTGLTTVFVQKLGRRVLEYLADVFSRRFFGPNLSEYARHLTAPGIKDIAFQEEQTPIIWARLGDGTLAACTYRRTAMFSSQPPAFMGWHRHTLGHGRQVVSVSAGTDPSTLSQALGMVTNGIGQYANTGWVEVFTQQQEPAAGLPAAWYVDGGLVPIYASLATQAGIKGLLLAGLWPLNGLTVSAWVAGLDAGDYKVVAGNMFIPFGGTFTLTNLLTLSASAGQNSPQTVLSNIGTPYIQAVIGSTYTSNGQRLRDLDPQASGTQMGPSLGKSRRVHMAAMLFDGVVAGSVSVGTSLTGVVPLQPISVTNLNETLMDPTQLFEGIWFDAIVGESDFEGQVAWQITRPYPCEVMAVETFQMTQER